MCNELCLSRRQRSLAGAVVLAKACGSGWGQVLRPGWCCLQGQAHSSGAIKEDAAACSS